MALSDEEREKGIVRLFDIFGQALYLTIKFAVNPATGGTDVIRAQWRNVGNNLVQLAKEDRD